MGALSDGIAGRFFAAVSVCVMERLRSVKKSIAIFDFSLYER